jgi:ribonuclease-3
MAGSLEPLQQALGYQFRNLSLLKQALTHRSFGTPHYERLEFVGDSILNLAIAVALFERFQQLREGDLSRLRAGLVKQDTLFRLAETLELGRYLWLGEGEMKSGGARRPSILADALEAIFAAVYLDSGFEVARDVVVNLFAKQLAAINPNAASKDPKTALQEWLQARKRALPRYELVEILGEAHAQQFEVSCVIENPPIITHGNGASRRIAEQVAAQRVLDQLNGKSN